MSKPKKESLPSVILLDVEGTTTSISFVKDILFPYARKNLEKYLDDHLGEKVCNEAVQVLMGKDYNLGCCRVRNDRKIVIEEISSEVYRLMDDDVKSTGLKMLQGMIWETAYNSGQVKAHVYPDVLPNLHKWSKDGIRVFIFSSGSVFAQKLLFGNTIEGNLQSMIEGHFDTTVGSKLEAASYKAIAKSVGTPAKEITFFTDNPREAYAALEAGFNCVLVDRPGNEVLSKTDRDKFPVVECFEHYKFIM